MYCPELGKWNGIDLLAEEYFDLSPYNYVANNPVKFIDPDGTWIPGKDGEAISWTVNDDGSVKWSENTTDEFKKIGESLWKSEDGKNSLYAMSSAESKLNVSTNDSDKTTINSKGEITVNGEKYAEEINISIGVGDGKNYEKDVRQGASVSAQYVNETNLNEFLDKDRLGKEYRELPFSFGKDPWMPYPERQKFEDGSTWLDGRTGKDITESHKILSERAKNQAEYNILYRKLHILLMNKHLQTRKSQRGN